MCMDLDECLTSLGMNMAARLSQSSCLLHRGTSRTEAVQILCEAPYVDSQGSWRESTWQDIENSLMSMQRTLPLNGLRPG